MFYDLNVPYDSSDNLLERRLSFLSELGYNVVALAHKLSGKLPGDLKCPIPTELPCKVPKNLRILRRCTLVLSDSAQNHRISTLQAEYDLLALRPVDEKTFTQACQALDCDIISLDLSQSHWFHFKFSTIGVAVEQGKRFEICYSPGIIGDTMARRNLISNATQLIRASRGRGLLISSEAKSALACRGPWDVINLAAVWGLGQERGYEAVSKEARTVVVTAGLRRSSYRGAIDVIYGGEKPPAAKNAHTTNRSTTKTAPPPNPAQLSKRQQKKLAHHARMVAAASDDRGAKRKPEDSTGVNESKSIVPKKQKNDQNLGQGTTTTDT